ncbi:hypothetical protein MKJ04_20430 [Pontibacter sp. E15-1]|uniref:hypothetical protein n=1 Tax=Pontibacter sp. E15-1 TaxID=2919918 RepID=UPI001F4F9FD9|nr:hypothetical protein [Pontibacter sp. E15-1]MCJ8167219.1 hypothetical protein [Pontibacter sp. E15-1]
MTTATTLAEIFVSDAGAVYQCDRRNRVLIDFAGQLTVLRVDAFLRLKRAVDQVDLEEMALSTSRADVELIAVCGCERCYVLTLPELYAFRELLAGAKFCMSLNSVLHECLSATFA